MKFIFKIMLAAFLLVVVTGCGGKAMDREHADFKYLNKETLKIKGYPNDSISDNTNGDKVKELKDEYVKWSATVVEVKGKNRLYLKEEELPKIEVKFKDNLTEDVKVGDIVTVSGTLSSYVNGLFGTVPVWKIKEGMLVETTGQDLDEVLAFQQLYNDEKGRLASVEEEKAEAERQKNLVTLEKQRVEQEKEDEYRKTPEGYLNLTLKEMLKGKDEILAITPVEDEWVVDFKTNSPLGSRISQSREIYEKIYGIDQQDQFDSVTLKWHVDFTNDYGKVDSMSFTEFNLSYLNAQNIHWDNFETKKLPQIADGYWTYGGE